MGVEPARVGEDPHLRGSDGSFLRSDGGLAVIESDPVGRHPEERKPGGFEAPNLGLQSRPASAQFVVVQLVGPRGRSVDEVGDAQAVFEQPAFLEGMDLLGREAGAVKSGPESVPGP